MILFDVTYPNILRSYFGPIMFTTIFSTFFIMYCYFSRYFLSVYIILRIIVCIAAEVYRINALLYPCSILPEIAHFPFSFLFRHDCYFPYISTKNYLSCIYWVNPPLTHIYRQCSESKTYPQCHPPFQTFKISQISASYHCRTFRFFHQFPLFVAFLTCSQTDILLYSYSLIVHECQ